MLDAVMERFGMLFLYASCGFFGENGIDGHSKAWNDLCWK